MTQDMFDRFMKWEEQEHGKILNEMRKGFDEVKADVKDINRERWMARGALIIIGCLSGGVGTILLKVFWG